MKIFLALDAVVVAAAVDDVSNFRAVADVDTAAAGAVIVVVVAVLEAFVISLSVSCLSP